jgi:peptidase E
MPGTIVAIGGADDTSPLVDFMLARAGAERPRVCLLATPRADDPARIASFYEALVPRACSPYHVELFGMPERPAERVAAADVVLVSGGNTANALVLWRLHGVDRALREAWERGAVLGGPSAGANCWFEASVTDSFGPDLVGLRDGLGFLAGSFCPHYDGEEHRRPVYERLVRSEGFPAGIACDDHAAAVFRGTALEEVVTAREGAGAYRVGPEGDEPIAARLLTSA